MKALAAPLIALLMTACTMPGQTPASPVCSFQPIETDAWVNMMPGPGGPPGNLTVLMKVEDDGISRRFEAGDMDADGTLRLDIVEWGPDEGLGKVVYRGKMNPKRIEIFCDGARVTSIDDVTIAQ